MAVITGTNLADTLFGTAFADTMDGGLDNDNLFGLGGIDIMSGGDGNDFLSGDEGDDDLSGNQGDDTLLGGSGNDTLGGAAGKDTLDGGEGNDVLSGAGGNDTLLGGVGNDTLNGGDNSDTLEGGAGNDVMNGGNGNDYIFSLSGADTIDGGDGNDIYWFFNDALAGLSTVADSLGTDSYDFGSSDTGVSADLRVGFVSNVGVRTFDETAGTVIENVYGSAFGDSIWGNDVNNILDGRAGGDTMLGGQGNDTYYFDSEFDTAIENANEGTLDNIRTTASIAQLADNIEDVYMDGTLDLLVTGNAQGNKIIGNSGNNIINGGLGGDRMQGGAGNDSYTVETPGDAVVEYANEGIDTIFSALSNSLGGNVENLILFEGSGATYANGNGLNNQITGNANNNLIDGRGGADTMSGLAGSDTYTVDNAGDTVTEGVDPGYDTVISSVSFTLGANVEALILTGSNPLFGTGNTLANVIVGTAFSDSLNGLDGDDSIDGGALGDAMVGGNGSDTYYVDNIGDAVVEGAGGASGIDTVFASVASYSLTANVEHLTLIGSAVTGQGNSFGNRITGNALANTLLGWDGPDTLDGGAGVDTMEGGAGGDTYYVDNVNDVVTEIASVGAFDGIRSTVTYTAPADVENLFLIGTANVIAFGNSLNNLLRGNSGNNSLYGYGGVDRMEGGAGNDYYIVEDAGDLVVENANEGSDRVYSLFTYTLPSNVERLDLNTNGADMNGTGNAVDNVLVGNNGANILNGLAGADTMQGGNGNDTFYVDNAGDVAHETSSTGGTADRVYTTVDYTIGANIEFFYLQGTANIGGTGNSTSNTIIGNTGNNVIDGAGGADTMSGGAGFDTYFVDNIGDFVSEGANAGTDTVHSSLTSATTPLNVENLVLLPGAINGTGTTVNNVITGNDAANTLIGLDGADRLIGAGGSDTLTGGNQADDFEFFFSFDGPDTITDFNQAENDEIWVSAAGFYGVLTPGTGVTLIANAAPVANAAAPQFLYNTTTGDLIFDYDGTISAGADHFATLTGAPPLTVNEINVY